MKQFPALEDWRGVPKPAARIEVRYTNFQNVLLIGLCAFFGLMATLIFYQTLTSPFSTSRDVVIKGAFCFCLFILVFIFIFLAVRAKRRAVKSFDETGITRGDGRHFPWSEFRGVMTQTARSRFGQTYVWRKELKFSNGETAWLIPQRIKNSNEVFAYVATLPAVLDKS